MAGYRLLISRFFVLVSVGLVSGSNVTVSVELSERGFSGVSLIILDLWMSSSVNTGCSGVLCRSTEMLYLLHNIA